MKGNFKQIKDTDFLGCVNFNDLCIYQGLRFPTKFKLLDFKKYDERAANMLTQGIWDSHGLVWQKQQASIQTFPRWFEKLNIPKIKKWMDLTRVFVE